MAYKLTYNIEQGIVENKYSGEIALEEILSATEEVWEMMQRHQSNHVLSDFLDAEMNFDLSQVMQVNEKIQDLGIPRNSRSAVVVPRDEASKQNMQARLYELSSGASGWPAQMFYDRDQAIEWLLLDE